MLLQGNHKENVVLTNATVNFMADVETVFGLDILRGYPLLLRSCKRKEIR